jgi:DNA-directed RNA polymerase subunit M/transcription elongation factor TFIIS
MSTTGTGNNANNNNMHPAREAVARHLREDAGLTREEACDAELGVYNWALGTADEKSVPKAWQHPMFGALYATKAKSVVMNFDPRTDSSSNMLCTRMREGEFAPHDVAFMKPYQVHPGRWKGTLDTKIRKEEYVYNEKPAAMTEQFRCGNCKRNECVYQELQLRSCDEPVTIFVRCLNCGKQWRMG